MKVTKSNKKTQTITITGDASEIVLLLDLSAKMAEIKCGNTSGIEKSQYDELLTEYSELGMSINNGDYFC